MLIVSLWPGGNVNTSVFQLKGGIIFRVIVVARLPTLEISSGFWIGIAGTLLSHLYLKLSFGSEYSS